MCSGGACAACSVTTNATNFCLGTACAFTCANNTTLCEGQCVDPTTCVGYGFPKQFNPCNTDGGVDEFGPGVLLGQQVSVTVGVTWTTVDALGVFGNQGGGSSVLALYTDWNGTPRQLVAYTAVAPIEAGENVFSVTLVPNAQTLLNGDYWIIAQYGGTSSICVDAKTNNRLVSLNYPSSMTAFPYLPATILSQWSTYQGPDINLFVRGH
jgi:hypothetical protein